MQVLYIAKFTQYITDWGVGRDSHKILCPHCTIIPHFKILLFLVQNSYFNHTTVIEMGGRRGVCKFL
jgi:hypothetical protein